LLHEPTSRVAVALILAPVVVYAQTTFTDVTDLAGVGNSGFGVGTAWGDLDNDGLLDLYVVNLGQDNALYLNSAAGAFQDITDGAGVGDSGDGVGCAWSDYDNDGFLDLFLTNRPGADRLYRNSGASTFTDVAPLYGIDDPSGWGESVAWGDYDNDGFNDLYKVRMQQPNVLYRSLSGEGFVDVTATAGVGDPGPGEACAWCDFDRDGDLDLFVTNANGFNLLYRNEGDHTFTDCADSAGLRVFGYSYGCAWGDYDNDGDFDLYVGRNGANKLYQNQADGTFEDVSVAANVASAAWTLGVAWADYDNDGWIDLHLAVHQGDDVLYRNLRDGTFVDASEEANIHNANDGRGNTWGDFNSDGFLDLYVANHQGAANLLYRNEGNSNHFLHLQLEGTASARDAIGSRVVCSAGGSSMSRQVDGGSGFASQNSLPLEFGLGENNTADSLLIFWPSGTVDTLLHLLADQFLQITEGTAAGAPFDSAPDAPTRLLLPPKPNPSTGSTSIRYLVPAPGPIELSIYDLHGRHLQTLARSVQHVGLHRLDWDPCGLPGGVYFCVLRCGQRIDRSKLSYLPER
jgi:hypothetical protein